MPIPGVHIECLVNPIHYSQEQIDRACDLAAVLSRGKLVLCVPAENQPEEDER